ncbi:MAG: TlpA family protein disulfide reductase [Bryobacteraceae bacterium]|nr:TlpA family protein disulfide reductase [Bryobacteraceae bacterium]MDW8380151.1 TlpA disulfide reductase family protein [Bryobacterales bacterium]
MRRRDLISKFVPTGALLSTARLSRGIELPRACPDFSIQMPDGKQLKLSTFQGKVIAVEFLLTYCSHCQRASRTTDLIYRELGPQGFQPVGVAIDPAANPLAYVRDLNLSFPVGRCAQSDAMTFLQLSPAARMMMPQVCFVDRRFTIRHQFAGDDPFFGENEEKNMRELVMKLLAEGSRPAAPKAPARGTAGKKKV